MLATKHRHWGKITVVLLLLLGIGFWVWHQFLKPEEPPETVNVTRGTVTETISLSGGIEPSVFADLAFVGSGRIASVKVAEGAEVKRGQILFTLENPVAQAQYQESLVAVQIAEEQEKLARRNWDSLKKEERAVNKLTSEQARVGTGVVSAQFVSNQVKAPFAGKITRLNARTGEVVSAGTIVARAEGAEAHLIIRVNVSESEVVKLHEGIEAEVTFDALGDDVFSAKLTSLALSSVTDQDVISYEAIFMLLDTDSRLRDGMTADLEVKTAERQNVLTLPARAVKKDEDGFYVEVYAAETKTIAFKRIEKGLEGDTGTVEVSGVEENEAVIVKTVEKE